MLTKLMRLAVAVGSLAGLALTANGLRPLARRGKASLYAFGFGVFASELPRQLIAGQLGLLLAATRWISPGVRAFSWLVSLVSWAGMWFLDRIGRDAGRPLNTALDTALGLDRRRGVAHVCSRDAIPTAQPRGLIGSMLGYRDYVTDADIAYGQYGRRNTLDIWRRPGCAIDGRAPVLIQIHGGAWMVGNKRQQAFPLMSYLAERGWICVSINYRLSPRSTWPAHIIDVKRAIAWTRQHIVEYGGDPDWIALTGGSAGGHLCALAALTSGSPRYQPGFENIDTSVRAAVPFCGVYDFTGETPLHPSQVQILETYIFKHSQRHHPQIFRDASPVAHVNAVAPPFFILHGTNDVLAPVEQGRVFASRLSAVSRQPVAYAELPYTQHAFDMLGSARTAHTVVAVEQFLSEVYATSNTHRASA